MKHFTVIIAVFGICTIILNAQDMSNASQLTFEPAREGFPSWSPDGKKIVFSSFRSWNVDIWILEVDIKQVTQELRALNE